MKGFEILEAFYKSGKKHIFITGSRSMGKSSLCRELSILLSACPMTTKAVYEEGIMPAYIQLEAENNTHIFARYNKWEHKITIDQEVFRKVTVSFLNNAKCQWISIDEIGYLEKDIKEYNKLLIEKLQEHHFILTLRKDKNTELLDYLRDYEDAYWFDLDEQTFDVSGIIMASGTGSRFGSNKLLAEFQGKTLIENILDQVPYSLFKEIILVTRYPEVKELAEGYPLTCVLHQLPTQSDTIRIGMEHISNTKGCMFITCDQPLRTKQSIRKLLLSFQQEPTALVRLGFREQAGNPVIFPQQCYEELKRLKPGEKGSTVIKAHKASMVLVQANHRYELADIDTPEDMLMLSNIANRKDT